MALLQIEAQHGRVLAAPPGVRELADHGAIGRHEGAVAGVDLVGRVLVHRQVVAGDAGLLVGVDHLAVLAHRELLVEAQPSAQRIAHQGGPRRVLETQPAEALRGAEQYVAQSAGLGAQVPVAHLGSAPTVDSRPQGSGGAVRRHGVSDPRRWGRKLIPAAIAGTQARRIRKALRGLPAESIGAPVGGDGFLPMVVGALVVRGLVSAVTLPRPWLRA